MGKVYLKTKFDNEMKIEIPLLAKSRSRRSLKIYLD